MQGICFDTNLQEFEDVTFYLISSRDNLILNINDKLICHTRKQIHLDYIEKNNRYSFVSTSPLKNITLSKKEFNKLMNRRYDIYDFNTKNRVIGYTLKDFLSV